MRAIFVSTLFFLAGVCCSVSAVFGYLWYDIYWRLRDCFREDEFGECYLPGEGTVFSGEGGPLLVFVVCMSLAVAVILCLLGALMEAYRIPQGRALGGQRA